MIGKTSSRSPSIMLRHRAWLVMLPAFLAWYLMASVSAQEQVPQVPPTPPQSEPVPMPVQPTTPVPPPMQAAMPLPQRFQFKIAANTPLKDLLPAPPKVKKQAGPVLGNDLAAVPEIELQAPLDRELPSDKATKETAYTIAKVNHLNVKKADRFIEALREQRLDLHGLPFAMGDACRTKGERSREFARAVATVRAAMQQRVVQTGATVNNAPNLVPPVRVSFAPNAAPQPPQAVQPAVVAAEPPALFNVEALIVQTPEDGELSESFWERYLASCLQEDRKLSQVDRAQREHVTVARIAALMQVLAPEAPSVRLGLAKYLSALSHVEATHALARLAIYSAEEEVRQAAVAALKVRREQDYTDILLSGLRYPWPNVARHAADAIVRLDRADLIPKLVDVLDTDDPRAPVLEEVDRKKTPMVRELVRINHHRNCLLCHAPGNTGTVSPETLTAAVPIPSEPLPSPFEGYRGSSPDVMVRIDVTYLRQDFSAYQAVADAAPWPEMQRFDFLVRTRSLSEEEAADYRTKVTKLEPGRLSPYHQAALKALRELTGKDTEPNAAAWRRLLAQKE